MAKSHSAVWLDVSVHSFIHQHMLGLFPPFWLHMQHVGGDIGHSFVGVHPGEWSHHVGGNWV